MASLPATTLEPSVALRERLRRLALELGFARAGFARADEPLEDPLRLAAWIEDGCHAGMGYLARDPARRVDPRALLAGARSLLAVAAPYQSDPGTPSIAAYARLADYHREMSARLERILAEARSVDPAIGGLACVDTRPVLERAAAAKAGLGWIGRNTMLLDVEHGPWTMLGVLLLTADLPPDPPQKERCGTCRRCLDACPTDAFTAPYRLDARRCLSYWTIEHRGIVPEAFRRAQGLRLFGCDDCLTACPFGPPRDAGGAPVLPVAPELTGLHPLEVIRRLEEGFQRHFKRFAIARAGKAGLLRNCLTVLGNAGDPAFAATAATYLCHADRGVRAHASWALGRIGDPAHAGALRQALAAEIDAEVRAEILHALHRLAGAEPRR